MKIAPLILILFTSIFNFSNLSSQNAELVLPIGHTGDINSAVYSPVCADDPNGGRYLITLSFDNLAKIWESRSGRLLYTLTSHTLPVTYIAFSPDGRFVLTASLDNTAKIWETKTGKLLQTLEGHTIGINTAVFSPDGKYILTASDDWTAKIWESGSGKLLRTLEGHIDLVTSAVFSPDGKYIVTASQDKTAKIWESKTGKLLKSLEGHTFYVNTAIFSPACAGDTNGGKFVLTASLDNTVKIWESKSGKLLRTIEGGSFSVNRALYSPDGKSILTTPATLFNFGSSDDHTAKIWESSTGKLLYSLDGHSQAIKTAVFSQDGKYILTASFDKTAKIWEAGSGKLLNTLKGHSDEVNSAIFSPNEKYILTVSNDCTAKIWDRQTGKLLNSLEGRTWQVNSLVFSPDGRYFLTSSDDKTAKIWDLSRCNLLTNMNGHNAPVTRADYSSSGKQLVTTSLDGTAKIWESSTGKLLFNLDTRPVIDIPVDTMAGSEELDNLYYGIKIATFSPDGKLVLFSCMNETSIWENTSGKILYSLKGNGIGLNTAVFSPSCPVDTAGGKYVLTSSNDGTAKIWQSSNGKLKRTLKGHTDWVLSAKYSPDGRYILTCSSDKTAKIWESSTGKLVRTIEGLYGYENEAVFSPACAEDINGGKYLLTITDDGKARIVESNSGNTLFILEGRSNTTDDYFGIGIAQYSPDGKFILTVAGLDNTIKIWESSTGKLIQTFEKHTDAISSVVFSPPNRADTAGGKFVFTISPDKVVKIWEVKSGKEIARFITLDSNGYFWMLPSGHYMGTKESVKKLYYVIDGQTLGFDQLDAKYNRPDLVLEVLGDISGEKDTILIHSYHRAWLKRIKKLGIDTLSFREGYSIPACDFENRNSIEYEQKNEKIRLHLTGMDSTSKLDRLNIWVDAIPVFGEKGVSIRKNNKNAIDTFISIELSEGENEITASVTNINGTESYKMPLFVNYKPEKPYQPKTYFIGIGIDHFKDSRFDLRYSVKDARDMANTFKSGMGANLIIDTLFNTDVTLSNVMALKNKLLQTNINDIVIISYSGHGLFSSNYDYYISGYHVDFDNPTIGGIPYEALEMLLDSIPARKKLLFIDACHSGEIDKEEVTFAGNTNTENGNITFRAVGNQLQQKETKIGMQNTLDISKALFSDVRNGTGSTVISAAGGMEYAMEGGDWKNGLFTYVLLNGLKNMEADLNHDGKVMLQELQDYVSKTVTEISQGRQQPTSRRENISVDYRIW